MMMKGFRAKVDYVLKHNHCIYLIFNAVFSLLLKMTGLFVRTDRRMILFTGLSFRYNDSPRAIYEKMIADSRFDDCIFVWGLDDVGTYIPSDPIKVRVDSLRYFLYSLKAKVWVACVNIERGLHYKKKGCMYLNTWHGVPLKYVGNDAVGRHDYDFRSIDCFCCSSLWEKNIYAKAFNVPYDAIAMTGLPRNDELYAPSSGRRAGLRRELGIPEGKRVILYAPTWRDSGDGGRTYSLNLPVNMELWKERLGDDYVILFRAHGYTDSVHGVRFDDFVRDVSSYDNVCDLFIVSDILISDYSASIIDYSILERPILCFGFDYEQYRRERGMYVDLALTMPGGVLRDECDVLKYIEDMDYSAECEKTGRMVKERFIHTSGNAADKCVGMIHGFLTGSVSF